MRAAVYQGHGALHKVERVADPSPGAGEVVLKVANCGICGTDVTVTAPHDQESPVGAMIDQLYRPGMVLGHEIAGEVVALGEGVSHLKAGDRIVAMSQAGCGTCLHCLTGKPMWCGHMWPIMGGYAEYARVSGHFSVKLPEALSYPEGALVEPLATSLHAVSSAGIKPGDRVLVFGAGIIGLGMAYFARRAGAARVVVVAGSERKRQLALRFGADAFLSQRPTLMADALELLGGPADVALEGAGAAGVVDQAVACLRPQGTLVMAGFMVEPDSVNHGFAMFKGIQIKYVMAYNLAEFAAVARNIEEAPRQFASLISASVTLDEFPEAFESLRSSSNHCKVMVAPNAAEK